MGQVLVVSTSVAVMVAFAACSSGTNGDDRSSGRDCGPYPEELGAELSAYQAIHDEGDAYFADEDEISEDIEIASDDRADDLWVRTLANRLSYRDGLVEIVDSELPAGAREPFQPLIAELDATYAAQEAAERAAWNGVAYNSRDEVVNLVVPAIRAFETAAAAFDTTARSASFGRSDDAPDGWTYVRADGSFKCRR